MNKNVFILTKIFLFFFLVNNRNIERDLYQKKLLFLMFKYERGNAIGGFEISFWNYKKSNH